MPRREVTYYFSLQSPWSYLGHALFMTIVQRHAVAVVWRPMSLATLFPESGGLPLAKRHPKRQAYRDIELQRWRLRRELPLNLRPAFWPLDIRLADGVATAMAARGRDPGAFVRRAFAALWTEDADLADPNLVARLLQETGAEVELIAAAQSDDTAEVYRHNTEAALEAGVFGAPTYVLDGELFWGQDRLELLEDALSSGRAPFVS